MTADHIRDDQETAVPDLDPTTVKLVMPGQLTGDEILIGDNGSTTAITGEVGSSWAHPGFHHVETEFGTLLLDSDKPVRILTG